MRKLTETLKNFSLCSCFKRPPSISRQLFVTGLVIGFFYLIFPWIDPIDKHYETAPSPLRGYEDIFQFFSWITAIKLFCVYSAVGLFGYHLARPLFSKLAGFEKTKFAASFGVGYVGAVALLRIVSLAFEQIPAAWISLVLMVAITIVLRQSDSRRIPFREFLSPKHIAGFILFTFFMAVLTVYIQGYYWYADPETHLKFLNEVLGEKADLHFPLLQSHYGGTIFGHWVLQLAEPRLNPLVFLWTTNSLIKVSNFFCIYIVFRQFQLTKNYALMGALYFLFGSLNFDFMKNLMLFDNFNPIFRLEQSDRIVAMPLYFSFLTYLILNFNEKFRPSASECVLFCFLGLGLPGTSAHNFVLLTFFAVFTLIFLRINEVREKKSFVFPWNYANATYGVLVLVAVLPCFAHLYREPLPGMYLVIAASLGSLLVAGPVLLKLPSLVSWIPTLIRNRWAVSLVCFLVCGGVSALFLGNIFSIKIVGRILDYLHSQGFVPGLYLSDGMDKVMHTGTVMRVKFFANVQIDEILYKPWAVYDRGGLFFISYYGLILFGALLVILFLRDRLVTDESRSKEKNLHFFWILQIVMGLVFINLFLFYTDFVFDGTVNSWVRSRLLEYPVYLVMFSVFVALGTVGSPKLHKRIQWLCGIQIVLPFFFHNYWQQFYFNFRFLWNFVF